MSEPTQHEALAKRRLTPLWIISLFLTLTETTMTAAVTQTTGGVQIALTAFAVGFPVLVFAGVFAILWDRPYVFYPPDDYRKGADVMSFVAAMQYRYSDIDQDKVRSPSDSALMVRASAHVSAEPRPSEVTYQTGSRPASYRDFAEPNGPIGHLKELGVGLLDFLRRPRIVEPADQVRKMEREIRIATLRVFRDDYSASTFGMVMTSVLIEVGRCGTARIPRNREHRLRWLERLARNTYTVEN